MSTDANYDPNEEHEKKVGPDHPNVSPADAWAEKQNPVRDTDVPFTNVRDGGTSSGG
jgi:hypothetical protein